MSSNERPFWDPPTAADDTAGATPFWEDPENPAVRAEAPAPRPVMELPATPALDAAQPDAAVAVAPEPAPTAQPKRMPAPPAVAFNPFGDTPVDSDAPTQPHEAPESSLSEAPTMPPEAPSAPAAALAPTPVPPPPRTPAPPEAVTPVSPPPRAHEAAPEPEAAPMPAPMPAPTAAPAPSPAAGATPAPVPSVPAVRPARSGGRGLTLAAGVVLLVVAGVAIAAAVDPSIAEMLQGLVNGK